ncbi:MAG: hypothetical protein WC790_01930 [Candidatus Paceibacterota bacterium]
MTTLMQSEIFFFISSIGFIILGVLTTAILVFILRAFRAFSRIVEKAEKDIDAIGDTTKEMLDDMRESSVFQFLFRRKRKQKSSTH